MTSTDWTSIALQKNLQGEESTFYARHEDFQDLHTGGQISQKFREAWGAVYNQERARGGIRQNEDGRFEKTELCGHFPRLEILPMEEAVDI